VPVVLAAILYFVIVFCAGFLLGAVRVTVLEPRLGETIATLCEAPFLLVAIVLAARWLPVKLGMEPTIRSLAAMGVGALVLQQLTDFGVGILVRGIAPAQHVAHLLTPAGWIYLALLVAFAAMPVMAHWPALRRS
jgi:hypothetical protein